MENFDHEISRFADEITSTNDVNIEFIYFILESEENAYVKIGKSRNVYNRLKDIQIGNPRNLKLIFYTNNYSESNLARYQHRCNQLLGFDLYVMHRLRQMLNKLSDKKTDNFIAFCKKMRLDATLQKHGDLDFQGKSLLPMMKYPGTLATISYFLYSYLTSLKNQ